MTTPKKQQHIKWTYAQEQLLIGWAEKSYGYSWMHSQSVGINKRYNHYISVPASIFGYLAGTATFLIKDPCEGGNEWAKAFIGISGILAGILSNFQQLFTFKELSEQHRISSLRFLVFFRSIASELSMSPKNRSNPIDFITMKRVEFDIMLEQSPTLPQKIIDIYNYKTKKFGSAIHKPEICSIIQTIVPYNAHNLILKKYNTDHIMNPYQKIVAAKYFKLWKGYTLLSLHKKGQREIMEEDIHIEVANSHIAGSEVKSHLSHLDDEEYEDTSSSSEKDKQSSTNKILSKINEIKKDKS